MNNQTFETPLQTLDQQDKFGHREVGITHPDVPGFVRIRDNEDIEIVASEGLAILMHPRNGTITFVADHINLMTRNEDGLRWNHVLFNSRATSFNEPTFITRNETVQEAYETFEGTDLFLSDIQNVRSSGWIRDKDGNTMTLDEYAELKRREGHSE